MSLIQRGHSRVFYAGLFHSEWEGWRPVSELPDGCYVYYKNMRGFVHWYHYGNHTLQDLTQKDVPPELLILNMLLT